MGEITISKIFEQNINGETKRFFREYRITCEQLTESTRFCHKYNQNCFVCSLKFEQFPKKGENIAYCEGSNTTLVSKAKENKPITIIKRKKKCPNVEHLKKIDPTKPIVQLETAKKLARIKPSAIKHKSSNIFERLPNAKIVPNVAPKPNLSPSKKRHKKKNNSVSNNTSSPVGRTLTTSPKYAFTKMKIHRSRKKNRYTISPQKYSTCWRCGAPCYGGTHYCFEHLKENNEY